MVCRKVNLLTFEGQFGQALNVFDSMDTQRIVSVLDSHGIEAGLVEYSRLATDPVDAGALYVCASHQNREIKSYIDDVLLAKFAGADNLIPSLALIRAHDNKGIQSILAGELGLPLIPQSYHVSPAQSLYIDQPMVFKKLFGAGSSQVAIVDDTRALENRLRSELRSTTPIGEISRRVEIAIRDRKKDARSIAKNAYIRPQVRFALQQFLPGLEHDYKVLGFGERFYSLRRKVKPGDFRASGSGLLVWDESPPAAILDAAEDIHRRLDTPHSSLDLVEYRGGVQLIEFQAVHFGPLTQLRSSNYHQRGADGEWEPRPKGDVGFEEEYARSLAGYVRQRVDAGHAPPSQ